MVANSEIKGYTKKVDIEELSKEDKVYLDEMDKFNNKFISTERRVIKLFADLICTNKKEVEYRYVRFAIHTELKKLTIVYDADGHRIAEYFPLWCIKDNDSVEAYIEECKSTKNEEKETSKEK